MMLTSGCATDLSANMEVPREPLVWLDDGFDSSPGKGAFKRAAPGLECPRLGIRVGGGGAGENPPVIKDLGDMDDGRRPLGGAQHEVVVLASVELRAQPPELLDQGALDDQQVTKVGAAQEKVG